jgi:hypothetical protein
VRFIVRPLGRKRCASHDGTIGEIVPVRRASPHLPD